MAERIVLPKEPFKTKEEAEEAFNAYQAQRRKKYVYGQVRRKAIRRAASALRRKYSSEYQTYLNRFTNELIQQWNNKEKERR